MKKKVFLLISTSLSKEEKSYVPKARKISSLLSNVDTVRSSNVVVGAYQIIAEIETDGLGQIGKFVNDNIMAIPGVDRCTVCLVLDGDKEREELAVGEIAYVVN